MLYIKPQRTRIRSHWIEKPSSKTNLYLPTGAKEGAKVTTYIRALLFEEEISAWDQYSLDLLPRIEKVVTSPSYKRVMTQAEQRKLMNLTHWFLNNCCAESFWEALAKNGIFGIMPDFFGYDNASAIRGFVDQWLFGSRVGTIVLLNLLLVDANKVDLEDIDELRFEASAEYSVLYGEDPTSDDDREVIRAQKKAMKEQFCWTNDGRETERAKLLVRHHFVYHSNPAKTAAECWNCSEKEFDPDKARVLRRYFSPFYKAMEVKPTEI